MKCILFPDFYFSYLLIRCQALREVWSMCACHFPPLDKNNSKCLWINTSLIELLFMKRGGWNGLEVLRLISKVSVLVELVYKPPVCPSSYFRDIVVEDFRVVNGIIYNNGEGGIVCKKLHVCRNLISYIVNIQNKQNWT